MSTGQRSGAGRFAFALRLLVQLSWSCNPRHVWPCPIFNLCSTCPLPFAVPVLPLARRPGGARPGWSGSLPTPCNPTNLQLHIHVTSHPFVVCVQYLSCPFPANLGRLERLEQLDLTMNDLTGSLDKEVADGEQSIKRVVPFSHTVVPRLPAVQSLMLPPSACCSHLSTQMCAAGPAPCSGGPAARAPKPDAAAQQARRQPDLRPAGIWQAGGPGCDRYVDVYWMHAWFCFVGVASSTHSRRRHNT